VENTSPGFTKTEWSVAINDGWLTITQLVARRRIGEIAIEVEDIDDPHGVSSGTHWADRPAQVWYRRRTYVVAPIGTRFRKRVWTPVRDKHGVRYSKSESDFELRGEERLVSLHIIAERAARKAQLAAQPERPLQKNEALWHLTELLTQLEPSPTPTPPPVSHVVLKGSAEQQGQEQAAKKIA